MEESSTPYENMHTRQDRFNWCACLCVMLLSAIMSLWLLWVQAENEVGGLRCSGTLKRAPVLCFNALVAVVEVVTLLLVYFERKPAVITYEVMGRPDIPKVQQSFVHLGQWTTFTIWCNTATATYFIVSTMVAISDITGFGAAKLQAFCIVVDISWAISFPMAFLVNIIVTFVLIPPLKKGEKFEILWEILRWIPQVLHNGNVMFVAVEAVLATPVSEMREFPIIVLFGLAYVAFSLALFAKTGFFHYFFLDPRFKFAPLAYLGLLALLTVLYFAGCVAVSAVTHSWLASGMIVFLAFGSCTFYDSQAKAPLS